MMNEHIELVKKWLADPKSVTQKELDENAEAAARAAKWAAYRAAYGAAEWAAYWAAAGNVEQAKYWVDEYEN